MAKMGEADQARRRGRRQRRLRGRHRRRAARFARHPRLLDQVETYIRGVFACAAEAMAAYERYKRTWGLVDFVDQDRLALELLGKRTLAPQLSERVQSVFVDEFQDTSPLQLAVFVGLSQIAEFERLGRRPEAVDLRLPRHRSRPDRPCRPGRPRRRPAATTRRSRKNYRSRPGLGRLLQRRLRTHLRERRDCRPSAVRIDEVERNDLPGQPTPLGVWRLSGEDKRPALRRDRGRRRSRHRRRAATGSSPIAAPHAPSRLATLPCSAATTPPALQSRRRSLEPASRSRSSATAYSERRRRASRWPRCDGAPTCATAWRWPNSRICCMKARHSRRGSKRALAGDRDRAHRGSRSHRRRSARGRRRRRPQDAP